MSVLAFKSGPTLTSRIEISLADGGSLTTGPTADNVAGFEIGRLPKPQWRIGMPPPNYLFFSWTYMLVQFR